MDVFNSEGGACYKVIDFEGSKSVCSEFFLAFGPSGHLHNIPVEMILPGFVVIAVTQALAVASGPRNAPEA